MSEKLRAQLTRRLEQLDLLVLMVDGTESAQRTMVAFRPWHKFVRAMRGERGNPLNLETLPMPREHVYDGTPASYANFCIGNRGIVMPTFGCPTDTAAADTVSMPFPGGRIVGFPATELVWAWARSTARLNSARTATALTFAPTDETAGQ